MNIVRCNTHVLDDYGILHMNFLCLNITVMSSGLSQDIFFNSHNVLMDSTSCPSTSVLGWLLSNHSDHLQGDIVDVVVIGVSVVVDGDVTVVVVVDIVGVVVVNVVVVEEGVDVDGDVTVVVVVDIVGVVVVNVVVVEEGVDVPVVVDGGVTVVVVVAVEIVVDEYCTLQHTRIR